MAQHQPVGVQFTETMKGYFSTQVKDDFEKAYQQGERDDSRFEFTLTVTIDDVDLVISDPQRASQMVGTVTAPALSASPLQVSNGRFYLFVKDPTQVQTRQMIYEIPLTTDDGKVYFMEGFKTIHDDAGPDMWSDTTTLYITVCEGDQPGGPVLGKGIVKIEVKDFIHQLRSMRAINAGSRADELRALATFGKYFSGVLNEIYGGIFARANVFNPDAPPRQRRELRCGDPDIHFFDTSDQVRLRLSRFKGGTKGPVLLSPGFGTSSLAFTIDTVDTNLPEYLYEHGYDVWVFDYRASPALASALTQFTLDDIALRDYPAAVAKIRQESGVDTIQAMVHCVGSLTFQMALSKGLQGVRSAVCSQLTLFSKSPTLNEVKAGLHLANFLSLAGVETLDTSYDTQSDWMDGLYDRLLRLYPTRERCNNPVCRRILFIYGEVYDHDQLNDATHDAIHEMFGPANVATFKHITRMVNAGHIVDASGNEAYLPYVEGLRIPIAFIHGENNRLFLPEGSQETYEYLCEKNGPQYYVRQVIPHYAHMDCFIGKNAARDVYPVVLAELEKYN